MSVSVALVLCRVRDVPVLHGASNGVLTHLVVAVLVPVVGEVSLGHEVAYVSAPVRVRVSGFRRVPRFPRCRWVAGNQRDAVVLDRDERLRSGRDLIHVFALRVTRVERNLRRRGCTRGALNDAGGAILVVVGARGIITVDVYGVELRGQPCGFRGAGGSGEDQNSSRGERCRDRGPRPRHTYGRASAVDA